MSDHVMWIVDLDSSLEDAETFAAQVKEWLVKKEIVSSVRRLGDTSIGSIEPYAQLRAPKDA